VDLGEIGTICLTNYYFAIKTIKIKCDFSYLSANSFVKTT